MYVVVVEKMIAIQKVFTKNELRAIRPKKNTLPLCKNCTFFKNGNCQKFTYINLVDGEETTIPALEARTKFDICGIGASHFQLKVEADVKMVDIP